MPRPRSDAARQKMLEAAQDIVRTVGVHGFTIDEVARRSGVAKTTIYRHFGSRNELIIASLDGMVPIPETPDTGSLRDDLIQFLHNVHPIFADAELRAVGLDVMAAAGRDPDLARLDRAQTTSRAGPFRTIFQRAQARGEIDPDIDYLTAFEVIEGPLVVRSLLWPERLANDDLTELVDRGLAALQADRA